MYPLLLYSLTSFALLLHLSFLFFQTKSSTLSEKEISALELKTNWLSNLASLSTLTGLLGTVIGIYQSFESMKAFKQASIEIFAEGIGTALITTIAGLIIALFSQLGYYIFTSILDYHSSKNNSN
ncbi:MAG: MotA/TolQ/ExbB proton channel family protein [Leptospiraceae bacterium]|nr:MotA/TolQ/ExbB proton channel family protein [Leptospiraceae bacterium]